MPTCRAFRSYMRTNGAGRRVGRSPCSVQTTGIRGATKGERNTCSRLYCMCTRSKSTRERCLTWLAVMRTRRGICGQILSLLVNFARFPRERRTQPISGGQPGKPPTMATVTENLAVSSRYRSTKYFSAPPYSVDVTATAILSWRPERGRDATLRRLTGTSQIRSPQPRVDHATYMDDFQARQILSNLDVTRETSRFNCTVPRKLFAPRAEVSVLR